MNKVKNVPDSPRTRIKKDELMILLTLSKLLMEIFLLRARWMPTDIPMDAIAVKMKTNEITLDDTPTIDGSANFDTMSQYIYPEKIVAMESM